MAPGALGSEAIFPGYAIRIARVLADLITALVRTSCIFFEGPRHWTIINYADHRKSVAATITAVLTNAHVASKLT